VLKLLSAKPLVTGEKMGIPTEADWGDYQADLDQKYAHDLFEGHTNQEMQPHSIERTDELRWMPVTPFSYYMLVFRDFVMAGNFDGWHAENSRKYPRLR
jgi:hypothetical protein